MEVTIPGDRLDGGVAIGCGLELLESVLEPLVEDGQLSIFSGCHLQSVHIYP
jgi:hypothetical protein